MCHALETHCVTLEVNDAPSSLCSHLGRPNLRMISWSSFFGGLFLWRTFLVIFGEPFPIWVVENKELTNFHQRFPGRKKKSPSFWNDPIWSSWKPSLLALRVSPSVYEGVFGKLDCGTKGANPVRSLFCNATFLAAWLPAWFPHANSMLPFWCPIQGETETSVGTTSKSLRIWSSYLIQDPQVVKWPLSFQIAACTRSTKKAYLESV